jgi:RimJ/RimL family protein N-acetyltransferase
MHPQAVEIGYVLRGESGHKGAMTSAMEELLMRIRSFYASPEIFLRVLPYNTHAIDFYERLGFTSGGIVDNLLHMTWSKKLYLSRDGASRLAIP